jgi:hypothetical protein
MNSPKYNISRNRDSYSVLGSFTRQANGNDSANKEPNEFAIEMLHIIRTSQNAVQ